MAMCPLSLVSQCEAGEWAEVQWDVSPLYSCKYKGRLCTRQGHEGFKMYIGTLTFRRTVFLLVVPLGKLGTSLCSFGIFCEFFFFFFEGSVIVHSFLSVLNCVNSLKCEVNRIRNITVD